MIENILYLSGYFVTNGNRTSLFVCTLMMAMFFLSPLVWSQEQFDIVTAPKAHSENFNWAESYGKSPTRFSQEDWKKIIDSTWGTGLSTQEKLRIFDAWFIEVDLNYGSFFNLDFDIFAFRDQYRPEIEAGVSRGRFAAIMNYFGSLVSGCFGF